MGLSGVVPFALETRLRELGARFESVPNWQPLAVRDGQLVTGQNPQSSAAVTAAVLQAFAERRSDGVTTATRHGWVELPVASGPAPSA